jgi:hypothetical protein
MQHSVHVTLVRTERYLYLSNVLQARIKNKGYLNIHTVTNYLCYFVMYVKPYVGLESSSSCNENCSTKMRLKHVTKHITEL